MSEAQLVAQVQLDLSSDSVRLLRNNVGVLPDRTGRPVRYGVGNPGGSDLIGWSSVTVTPEMVGTRIAIICAIECKHGRNKPTDAQQSFIDAVVKAGGRAGVAYSTDDARRIIAAKL